MESKQIDSIITYKVINDDYSEGVYLNTKVIIMNDNGYINATKFCTQHKKELHRSFELDRKDTTMKIIQEMEGILIKDQTLDVITILLN